MYKHVHTGEESRKGNHLGKGRGQRMEREARAVGDKNKREWPLYMNGHNEAHYFVCWLETQKASETSNLENPQNLQCYKPRGRQVESPTWLLFAFSFRFLLLRVFPSSLASWIFVFILGKSVPCFLASTSVSFKNPFLLFLMVSLFRVVILQKYKITVSMEDIEKVSFSTRAI